MRVYLTIVLVVSLISFLAIRALNIKKAEKASIVYSNLVGIVLEIGASIIAIVFAWKI